MFLSSIPQQKRSIWWYRWACNKEIINAMGMFFQSWVAKDVDEIASTERHIHVVLCCTSWQSKDNFTWSMKAICGLSCQYALWKTVTNKMKMGSLAKHHVTMKNPGIYPYANLRFEGLYRKLWMFPIPWIEHSLLLVWIFPWGLQSIHTSTQKAVDAGCDFNFIPTKLSEVRTQNAAL